MANVFLARQGCSQNSEANEVPNQNVHDRADDEFENSDITTFQNTNINNQSNDNSQITAMRAEEGAVDNLAGSLTINKAKNDDEGLAHMLDTSEDRTDKVNCNDSENNENLVNDHHFSEEEEVEESDHFEDEDASEDKCLSKMQIMEDVREGCDTNPPSSPGHAEQGEDSGLKEVKKDATLGNGLLKAEIKSEMEISEVVTHELYEKRSNDEVNDKQEENSNHSLSSENNEKRKLEPDNSSIKRRKTEIEDSFTARDKIIVEFMELAECNNLEQVQNLSDQIFSEIKALNELAREKEKEWNQLLHMKKLKEELLIRLQRKRQVLIINDSDLNEFQPETNGQQSLLKCNQKVNMLRELRAANIEKLKQRNMLQTASKQKPMLDVQSIIADYRQRHPESVPRRGGSLTIGQSAGMDNHESGLSGSLNGFAKLSQSEKSELQTQMQNLKPPPPYPEVTVHPVTSTSSVTPTNSLLHGILTKAPVKQSHSNGNNHSAMNGKSTFSPTLARLLTAPEKAAIQSSTPNMLGGSLLNASNMSISDIFSGGKVRNEITITPLGGQFETPAKRELIDEDEQADRLVIDEALDNSGSRIKEDNRSDDGEEVPQCQGCNQQAAQFVCAGCGNQWYCSRDCQVAAWDDHSELCSG